jgi:hypothetical protein
MLRHDMVCVDVPVQYYGLHRVQSLGKDSEAEMPKVARVVEMEYVF